MCVPTAGLNMRRPVKTSVKIIELLKSEIALRDQVLEGIENLRSELKLLLESSGRIRDAEASAGIDENAAADETAPHSS
jgi:hypothetical protein